MTTVNIEIDGRQVEARNGAMLIEAADEAGINIPRFCYHKKLSIAANCRMCLVEVEKAAKPLPACATPVTDGMKVFTRSPKAIRAQKGVMEFLLINHPLDCPICDQGGECELQDVAVGFGKDESRFCENKRIIGDKDIGPLISTDMTRCIHCTRCVRFGDEIAGVRELGATGRGEHMEIGTYIESSVGSELSGNVIDLCPVGALTAKPFRFSARAWEMTQSDSIAAHDCIGSNTHVHVRRDQVMRVVPKDNESINENWLSDRDRFSYEGANSEQRLTSPMIKVDGQWQETDWNTALENVLAGFKKTGSADADQLGCLISPSATLEEHYLAQKLLRGLGSANIDHRLRQLDFSDQDVAPLFPWLGQSLETLEQQDAVLLVGSNIRKDQPLAAHRIRKASLNGASVFAVNAVDYDFNFAVAGKLIAAPHKLVSLLAGVAKALTAKVPSILTELVNAAEVSEQHQSIANKLKAADKSTVLLGLNALHHPEFSTIRTLANLIAQASESTVGLLSDGCNSAGASLAGAMPHLAAGGAKPSSLGLTAWQMISQPRKGYLLIGIEPLLDCANGARAIAAISSAEYVVAMSAYRSADLEACADVLLPITPATETSGTYINAEGTWQSFNGCVAPRGESRPVWKVLRVMGNLFELDGFDYIASDEVTNEVKAVVGNVTPSNQMTAAKIAELPAVEGLVRVNDLAIYGVDGTVRRSPSLQATADGKKSAVFINRQMAERAGVADVEEVVVTQGDAAIELPLIIDNRVADDAVLIYSGVVETASLTADYSPITIHKA